MSIAPTRTMPWIELAADISGVCRVAGTLLMTSNPTSTARTKMVMSVSRAVVTGRHLRRAGSASRAAVAGWITDPPWVMTTAAWMSSSVDGELAVGQMRGSRPAMLRA